MPNRTIPPLFILNNSPWRGTLTLYTPFEGNHERSIPPLRGVKGGVHPVYFFLKKFYCKNTPLPPSRGELVPVGSRGELSPMKSKRELVPVSSKKELSRLPS